MGPLTTDSNVSADRVQYSTYTQHRDMRDTSLGIHDSYAYYVM